MRTKAALLLVFLSAISPLAAEAKRPYRFFFDLYGGINQLADSDVEATDRGWTPKRTGEERAEFDPSLVLGLRNGIWRENREGFGLWWDLSFFQAKGGTTSMDMWTLSGLIGWGWSLSDADAQAAGWSLYLAGGLGLLLGRIETDAEGVGVGGLAVDDRLDLRLGAMWHARRKNAGYLELRSMSGRITAEDHFGWSGDVRERITMDLDAWQLLVGWSVRLGAITP